MFALSLVLTASNGFADDTFYIGTWKIESAMVAPWWTEREKPDPAEMKTLVGRAFSITAKSITGPRQLAVRRNRKLAASVDTEPAKYTERSPQGAALQQRAVVAEGEMV